MDTLKISSTAFDAAGGALDQASGLLSDANQVNAGDAGYSLLVVKGKETADAWRISVGPLTEALVADGKQCIAAGQEFGRVDEALVGALASGTL